MQKSDSVQDSAMGSYYVFTRKQLEDHQSMNRWGNQAGNAHNLQDEMNPKRV